MAKVEIAFSADLSQIGKTVEVDDEQAAALVREGRARYVNDKPSRSGKPRTTNAETGSTP